MSATTFAQVLRAEGGELVENEHGDSVVHKVFMQPSDEAPQLDNVFKSFSKTNMHQDKHYDFDMIMGIGEKRQFMFTHAGVDYRACVQKKREPYGKVVVLWLPNAGYTYREEVAGNQFVWDKQPGWVALGPEAIEYFPTLESYVSSRYTQSVVLYNRAAKRISVEFENEVPGALRFRVSFETGSTYLDIRRLMHAFQG